MTVDPTGRLISAGASKPAGPGVHHVPKNIDADQVERIISVTGRLPRVPPVAAQMMELVGRQDATVWDLEKVISSDRVLAARILETANSVFYSFDQKISALSHAIVILGFRAVQSMSIAHSSCDLFRRGMQFGPKEKHRWEHSIGCAMSCRQISRVVGYKQEETAFITGLLHDVGKAVLYEAIPKRYGRIVEIVDGEPRSLAEVENENLGFHHGHVGALIAQRWNFSGEVVEAIATHHEARTNGGALSAILAASNDICHGMDAGTERVGEKPASDGWAAAALSLDEKACSRVREMVTEIVEVERKLYEL
jgi:putative nucleotidyltransferase with HDIG domain